MFSDEYVRGRLRKAFSRLIFGLSTAFQMCPTEADSPIFNKRLVADLMQSLSPEQGRLFSDGMRDVAERILERIESEGISGEVHADALTVDVDDPVVSDAVNLFIADHLYAVDRIPIEHYTLEATLVSTASAFEAFCGQVACAIFLQHPKSIPGEPKIPFGVVLEAANLRDLMLQACETAARAQISGPVETWLRFLAERAGGPLPKRITEWPTDMLNICRVFALRNCIVHRGGVVDATLIERMTNYRLPVGKLGERLFLPPNTVKTAISTTCSVAARLYLYTATSQASREHRSHAGNLAVEVVTNIQWMLIRDDMSAIAKQLDCTDHVTSEVATTHEIATWTARLLCGDAENVKQEIAERKWPETRVAQAHRAALEGDGEKVKQIVQAALGSGEASSISMAHTASLHLIRIRMEGAG